MTDWGDWNSWGVRPQGAPNLDGFGEREEAGARPADTYDWGVGTDADGAQFSQSAERAQPTRPPEDQVERARWMERAVEAMQQGTIFPDTEGDAAIDELTNFLRAAALTGERSLEANRPSMPSLQRDFTPGRQLRARMYDSGQLVAADRMTKAIEEEYKTLRALARGKYQDEARELGLTDEWFMRMPKEALKVAKRSGAGALAFVLGNLNRAAAAVNIYADNKWVKGRAHKTALEEASEALIGSENGFVWVPQIQGRSYEELLYEAGIIENDFLRGVIGTVLDVGIDPLWLVGGGMARNGVEISAHQILNSKGRRKFFGEILPRHIDEAMQLKNTNNTLDLGLAEWAGVRRNAELEMRALVNTSEDTAKEFLDLGSLKIAGYTLPVIGRKIRKQRRLSMDKLGEQPDLIPATIAHVFGVKASQGAVVLGRAIVDKTPLPARLGRFIEELPEKLRHTSDIIGDFLNRTNPNTGKEYIALKHSEYFDLFGFKLQSIRHAVDEAFRGVKPKTLNEMSLAIDGGKWGEYITALRKQDAEYAQVVEQAYNNYRKLMEEVVVDSVRRNWIHHVSDAQAKKNAKKLKDQAKKYERRVKKALRSGKEPPDPPSPLALGFWNRTRRTQFGEWVAAGRPRGVLGLDHAGRNIEEHFVKTYNEGYVPHIYMDKRKREALERKAVRKETVSITDVHTFARKNNMTLGEALEAGYKPELNLYKLTILRLESHARAAVTSDFLQKVSEKVGFNYKRFAEDFRFIASDDIPEKATLADLLANARIKNNGRFAMSLEKQIDLAEMLAFEGGISRATIAKFDDEAISAFLERKLNIADPAHIEKIWNRYVVEPTVENVYNGKALAPAPEIHLAVTKAKRLGDPLYTRWVPFNAAGHFDPEIIKTVYLPKPIADDLQRLQRRAQLDPAMGGLIRAYEIINNFWKRSVTIFWPAFHVRNKMTNVLNSSLDIGIHGVLDRGDLWGIMHGGEGYINTPAGIISYDVVREAAKRYDIHQIMYRRADAAETLADAAGRDITKLRTIGRNMGIPLPGRGNSKAMGRREISLHPAGAAEDIALLVENSDRMQLFVQSLKRGMSFEQSAKRVKQFLFDYQDISNFERTWMRRLFNPFWTFTRKNVALQFRSMVKEPARWMAFPRFVQSLNEERDDVMRSDLERVLLPEYFVKEFGVRIEAAPHISTYLVNLDLPHADIGVLGKPAGLKKTVFDVALGTMQPYMRFALEELLDYDFQQRGGRMKFSKGAPVYEAIVELKGTPGGDKLLNWLDIQENWRRDERYYTVNGTKWRWLMLALAFSGQSRVYTSIGGAMDKRRGSATARLANFMTGMRIHYLDPERELRQYAKDIARDPDGGLAIRLRQAMYALEAKIPADRLDDIKADKEIDDQLRGFSVNWADGESD